VVPGRVLSRVVYQKHQVEKARFESKATEVVPAPQVEGGSSSEVRCHYSQFTREAIILIMGSVDSV
jgi:hypothetical protein